jgi:hypothetical protein
MVRYGYRHAQRRAGRKAVFGTRAGASYDDNYAAIYHRTHDKTVRPIHALGASHPSISILNAAMILLKTVIVPPNHLRNR